MSSGEATPLLRARRPSCAPRLLRSWKCVAVRFGESRLASALPAALVAFGIAHLPAPEGLTATAMRLLGVFAGTIVGLLTSKYDMSTILAVALLTLTLTRSFMCTAADGQAVECAKCRTMYRGKSGHWHEYKCDPIGGSFDVAVSGFSSKVVWLVFCAFNIGRAMDKTGLGRRVSLALVGAMGQSAVGIGYAVCLAELALAPFIPSNTARGGGIVYPIVESVIAALGVEPQAAGDPVGGFLSMVGASANLVASSLFVTGMAGNPIVASKAEGIFGIEFGFYEWVLGASVPALALLLLLPPLLRALLRPQLDAAHLSREIRRQSSAMGAVSGPEYTLCATLLACLALWVGTPYFGIDAAVVAFMAVVVLVLADVLAWDDVAKNHKAWDTFFWLAAFIVLAEQLTALGVTGWVGTAMSRSLHGAPPLASAVSLALAYFFTTYLFSSITSHVVAFAGPFFAAGQVLGCPPYLLTILVALFSSIAGLLTPFSTGTVAIYASQGYVSQPRWFLLGLLLSFAALAIVSTAGMAWWWLIGWY
ncbi:hypothetical protein H4R18_005397 [Coemansia javaensis]|uniref:Uncharacterized protein n=1 Tax=Coemansia javaensis TaxID=2761396 RepID=A0A9W8LFE9_9FUNG|nr:hypothetical protein H4R18_005397 [Coemansia javaensis]